VNPEKKANCWEVMNCGREPGGKNVPEMGICPASVETRLDGINGGKNGGRSCWAITGTLCEGKVQGSYAVKMESCLFCDFYKRVSEEEGGNFEPAIKILLSLRR
jgi:hypothetical protein